MAGGQEQNMENRDPNGLNSHIQVMFEDVLGEPDGAHSIDCVWRNAYNCFECGKNLCYKLMTTLCGICIALEWGCEFAMVTFNHVWCWTPMMRDLSITVGCCSKFVRVILDCCCVPWCEAMGACFSKIKITKG